MKKLYLIDGMSLVFRSYHALLRMELTNPAGEPSGAVFGFTNIITTFLEKEKPENVAVVFDCREPTFRHKLYDEYKANRAAFPEELAPQLPKIKQVLDLMGIPRLEKPGFEADDVIGTLAKIASKQEIDVLCLTNDKDYYQLVDEHIQIMKPVSHGGGFEYVSFAEVQEKFGVTPDRVIDVMALWGDASDNIPGVKGIGEKTAIPLISEFGNLEGLYENIDKVERKAVKAKLEKDKENAFLSKTLVTIVTDVECDKNIDELKLQTPDYIELDKFFKTEGMTAQRNKWFEKGKSILIEARATEDYDENNDNTDNTAAETAQLETIEDLKKEYIFVDNEAGLDDFIAYIQDKSEFAFDLETSGLDVYSCDIVGMSFSAEENKAYYIAVAAPKSNNDAPLDLFAVPEETFTALPVATVINKLKALFENPSVGKYGQNIKFDASILYRYGINVSPLMFDSMLASYLLDSNSRHGLDALSEKYLNYSPIPISSLIGEKKKEQRSMADINPAEISDYACEDADLAYKLKQILSPKLEEANLSKLADEIEFPLIEVLIAMEQAGVSINQTALAALSKKIGERLVELTADIYKEAAAEFNIDSPKQLAHILFEKLNLPPVKKTKTGYSTDVDVLTQLSLTYDIAKFLMEYRTLQKLKTTYIDSLPKLVKKHSNRIHTTFNQQIAGTGRLTSTDPNLQNIPIRTDLGKEIRNAFVASDDEHIIFAADYSQVELRIMAYMCGDEQMIESFKHGLDIHSATAATLFDKTVDEVSKDDRRAAKTVNFGIMYGLGAFGLAQRLDITRSRAKEIIDNYFLKFPFIQKYMNETIESTREKGYAETLCGRRRYFEDINSKNHQRRASAERAAINMPIQGSAADMMKIAMINVHNEMRARKLKSKMILQVHDELVFDVYKPELEELKALVVDKMETAMLLGDVPVVVDCGTGESWFDAH